MGNYDIEVTLYPKFYYYGSVLGLDRIALGAETTLNGSQNNVSSTDAAYARIQPNNAQVIDTTLIPVIGVAVFEDKTIAECDLNNVGPGSFPQNNPPEPSALYNQSAASQQLNTA